MKNFDVIVFDIGGTLMEYRDMPNMWADFYKPGFEYVRKNLGLDLTDEDLEKSVDILKSFNPKINYREIDYKPEKIFSDVTAHWKIEFDLKKVIDTFFSSMKLTPYIYPETIQFLKNLRDKGYIIATFTDVATGMPDELHKSCFEELLEYFDLYVSSISCGYRKPNPKALQDISAYFKASVERIVFIGDEEKDIATAKRFGCKSVLTDRKNCNKDYGQDYTITNLEDLTNII